MRFGFVLLAVCVAAFVLLPGVARAGDGCRWYFDNLPWFPPGVQPVNDSGDVVTKGWPFGSTVRHERWNVIIVPGYMFAALHAMEDITVDFTTGRSLIDKHKARICFYNVLWIDCCNSPSIATRAECAVNFDAWVQVDAPGEASAAGLTTVTGTNTGLSVQADAGAECGSSSQGSVTFKFSVGGQSIEYEVEYEYGEDEQEDSASDGDVKFVGCVDEEYIITHELDCRTVADADPLNWYAHAKAWIYNHNLWIRTTCGCYSCQRGILVQMTLNKSTLGITEDY